ncbi:MAG: SIMPL domain-containing protein [Chloroflexia bacterium]|nr:SIMPL domain-containing protein [Chloroflexia bacterium]
MPQENQRRLWALRTAGIALALAGLVTTSGLSTGIAAAQDMATPESGMALGVPTVSVSGHGEVNVPPDTASVNIGVDVIKPTLDEAQEQATAQATAVIEAMEAAGVAPEDIQTDYFSVNILRDYSENADPTLITGFEIINQLRVTVRDTDQLGELLDDAVNAGANSIYGVSFYVDDQTAAASDARVDAVADARTKAEELATASGMTLGPVVSISEGTSGFIPPVYGMARGGGMAMDAAAAPVEPGSTTVAVDVQMTFELRAE